MVEAAGKLIRERAKLVEEAVRARDTSWSDDYGDRAARGRLCGAGLGVCLGIASQSVGGAGEGGTKLTPEERTECLLDLHGLHAAEAAEVMEEFLLAVSGCCCCCCFFRLVREASFDFGAEWGDFVGCTAGTRTFLRIRCADGYFPTTMCMY